MSCYTQRARRARTIRYGCHVITPGELYVEHTEFPGGEAGYADAAGHPVRIAECRGCAERYSRSEILTEYERNERPPGGLQCGDCGRFCSPRTAVPIRYFPDVWIDHYICPTCNNKENETP